MVKTTLIAFAIALGPCSSQSDDSAPAASAEAPKPAAASATATAPATAVATATATSTAAPGVGPCVQLGQMCSNCSSAATKTACGIALAAGGLDPKACEDALRDKDIQRLCAGGGAAPGRGAANPPPHGSGAGPCVQLGKMCPRCSSSAVKSACSAALAAGSLDPKACEDGLRDWDIQRLCK